MLLKRWISLWYIFLHLFPSFPVPWIQCQKGLHSEWNVCIDSVLEYLPSCSTGSSLQIMVDCWWSISSTRVLPRSQCCLCSRMPCFHIRTFHLLTFHVCIITFIWCQVSGYFFLNNLGLILALLTIFLIDLQGLSSSLYCTCFPQEQSGCIHNC